MMNDRYYCKNKGRRQAVRGQGDNSPRWNGIDYLEVMPDQKTLKLYFIFALKGELNNDSVVIEGGERIKDIRVKDATLSADKKILTIELDKYGDFSTYTLFLAKSGSADNFDPQLSRIDFSFKVQCHADFDCRHEIKCPPEQHEEPEINYLAKDYASFKNLIMDRLSVILPDWKERNPADLMVALVELLAYTGDNLSYYQDAVATEAYLGTARRRTSIRRHARLLDYFMHEGCNARVWVYFEVDSQKIELPAKTILLTGEPDNSVIIDKEELIENRSEGTIVFETMYEVELHSVQNKIYFYTWDDSECCLPRGSTRATLIDQKDQNEWLKESLKKGDFLVFEEVKSPLNGKKEDADPAHRHVVRLTSVKPDVDFLNNKPVVEIEWHEEDAIPFPLCISAMNEEGTEVIEDISVAHGNVVLADHGLTVKGPLVPKKVPENRSYSPVLLKSPLTYIPPFDPEIFLDSNNMISVASAMKWDLSDVRPDIKLNDDEWICNRDLLQSDRFSKAFVVETESDGTASIRFGDNIFGKKPNAGSEFTAEYRIGNGKRGNVGVEAISIIVPKDNRITKIKNPLPASGGIDPEPMEYVRLFAPYAFRTQERAVTEEDYSMIALRHPEVQRAAATIRWTGSWHTVFVTVDRKGGKEVDMMFKKTMQTFFERYRLAGYDLEINGPVYVPLDISMIICVMPGYFRSNVRQSLLEVFSDQELENGKRGFFHPDNFTFGDPVYLSDIYKMAVDVPGVASINVTKFQRLDKESPDEKVKSALATGRLEVIRLDNDPNFPQNGKIEFIMKGGL